jgi:hypothetical protein
MTTVLRDNDLRLMVERELQDGERVMWMEQPRPGGLIWTALPIVLFAIPWTGFAVFWMVNAWRMGSDLWFALFGLPFVLVGLGMLSAPLWLLRKARRTVYAVTDRRAFTLVGGRSVAVENFRPEQLTHLSTKERADGSGDIVFSTALQPGISSQYSPQGIRNGFFGVPNVKEAETFLRALAARAERS